MIITVLICSLPLIWSVRKAHLRKKRLKWGLEWQAQRDREHAEAMADYLLQIKGDLK